MNYLNKITSEPYQQFFLTATSGRTVTLTMRYLATQNTWIMDVDNGEFAARGVPIVSSPNILRQFRNFTDFGFCCTTVTGMDPLYADDFATQAASLYLLDQVDVLAFEESFFS